MTQMELERCLKSIKYYDDTTKMYKDNIRRKYPVMHPLVMQTWIEQIKQNEEARTKAVSLLDYAANEADRKILYMRYVEHKKPFEIADSLFYGYSTIFSKLKDALQRLAENVKNVPPLK